MTKNDSLEISGKNAHHIANVLRYKPGDKIKISNGAQDGIGVIQNIDKRKLKIKIKIIEKNNVIKIWPIITIYQGLLKGEKMDFVVQKNTEIGMSKLIPLITERTVVNPSDQKINNKIKRWEKIAEAASKQCMRPDIPSIGQVMRFNEAIINSKRHEKKLILWELEETASLKHVLKNVNRSIHHIAILIGPEGGFTEDEVRNAVKAGFQPISLGPRILRSETASLAVCSIIMYELGDIGGSDA